MQILFIEGDVFIMNSTEFFYDWDNKVFYLVNFREETYMKIAEEGSVHYELCTHLSYTRWEYAETSHKILSTFKKVDTLKELSGTE